MAYVIFTANGDEVDRRKLTVAVTIGRAQDVDVPVRDILLSRKHCRLEPSGDHWIVTDLGSKNGTYLGYRQITRHQLKDGEELRIGRTRMTFRTGPFEPAPSGVKRRELARPADPTEALAGTVAGFILVEPGEVERAAGAPVPQPRPPEPTAFASEDVYGMLNEIASSSWDSIMAQASRPLVMERPLPRPSGYRAAPPVARHGRVAFSLQAPAADTSLESPTAQLPTAAVPASTNAPKRTTTPRWWNVPAKAWRQVALGGIAAAATTLLVGAWIVAVNQSPRASAAETVAKPRGPRPAVSPDLLDITFPAPPAPEPAPARALPTAPAVATAAGQATAARPFPDVLATRDTTLWTLARVVAVRFFLKR